MVTAPTAQIRVGRSARHPRSGGAGEDGGQRLDHRLGRFARARPRSWPASAFADPPAEPVQRDGRTAVALGIGAGIGAIFAAPLGGRALGRA